MTIPIIYKVISRLIIPIKVIYSSIQVSDVLVLNASCKLINFVFQIFPLFIPEIPSDFVLYIAVVTLYLSYTYKTGCEKSR
jgi:hypothetical protein